MVNVCANFEDCNFLLSWHEGRIYSVLLAVGHFYHFHQSLVVDKQNPPLLGAVFCEVYL